MDAIQFIKEHGADKAMEVVECAPEGATHLSDGACHYVNADFKPLPAHIKEQLPELIVIDDLKRLVESLDLVKSYGGIINAKNELILLQKHLNNTFGYVTIITSEKIENLEQAIADYESIYGGEHV